MKWPDFTSRGRHCTNVNSTPPQALELKYLSMITADISKTHPMSIKLKNTHICAYLCHHVGSSTFTDPTSTYTETVHKKENRGRTGEQRQLNGFRCKGLDCEQQNRCYRWPARRAELWPGEDWRPHRSQRPLCFLQQMHSGKGRTNHINIQASADISVL